MKDPLYKGPEEIDLELLVIEREKRRARLSLGANLVFFLLVLILNGILFRAAIGTFPKAQTLFTTNAAAVCSFSPVSEPGEVSDTMVREFATTTVVDLHTLDYMNWRKSLDRVTARLFTVEARQAATDSLKTSGILPALITNSYVLTPVITDIATIQSAGVKNGIYQWVVNVPVVIAYTGSSSGGRADYRPENRVVTVTVSRVPNTADHPEGLIVSGLFSSQAVSTGDPGSTTTTITTTETTLQEGQAQ